MNMKFCDRKINTRSKKRHDVLSRKLYRLIKSSDLKWWVKCMSDSQRSLA